MAALFSMHTWISAAIIPLASLLSYTVTHSEPPVVLQKRSFVFSPRQSSTTEDKDLRSFSTDYFSSPWFTHCCGCCYALFQSMQDVPSSECHFSSRKSSWAFFPYDLMQFIILVALFTHLFSKYSLTLNKQLFITHTKCQKV